MNTILLVDDDADDRELFGAALSKVDTSITLVTATDAREALHQLRHKIVEPDLMFVDLNMPGKNGLDLLKEIKQAGHYHMPVYIYTTASSVETKARVSNLGGDGCLTKPVSFKELTSLIRSVIEKHA